MTSTKPTIVAVPFAAAVLAPQAGGAGPARQEHLDRHPIPGIDAPALGRRGADLFDHADRLVAWHEGEASGQGPGELLVVGAAQAARLHPQQAVVVTEIGKGEHARREVARRLEHRCPRRRSSGHARLLIRRVTASAGCLMARYCHHADHLG